MEVTEPAGDRIFRGDGVTAGLGAEGYIRYTYGWFGSPAAFVDTGSG